MTGPILHALGQGYTAKQIVQYLLRKFPQHATKIQAAVDMGYGPDKIIKFLTKGRKGVNAQEEEEPEGVKTEHEQTIASKEENKRNRQKKAAMAGAGLLAAGSLLSTYAMSRAVPQALQGQLLPPLAGQAGRQAPAAALRNQTINITPTGIPNQQPGLGFNPQAINQPNQPPQLGLPQLPPQAPMQGQGPQAPIQPQGPIQPRGAPTGPSPTLPGAPAVPSTGINAKDIIDKMGIGAQVQTMAKSQPPEMVAKVLEQMILSPGQKKWLKDNNVELPAVIAQFLSENPPIENANPLKAQDQGALQPKDQVQPSPIESQVMAPSLPEQALPQPSLPEPIFSPPIATQPIEPEVPIEEPPVEAPKETKPNLVALPSGDIGTVESVKDGIAKVNVDGVIKHRKLDELTESPLDENDLAEQYQKLINMIPEKDKSAVIYWAGFDPNTNTLAFIPHNGALYTYENIEPEFADMLKNSMFKAKTTGENYIAAWEQGGESRFAGLHQLIKKLQAEKGGKGKEYSGKFEEVHSLTNKPRMALKAKKAEAAKREREEKKKLKPPKPENEKKRKKTTE